MSYIIYLGTTSKTLTFMNNINFKKMNSTFITLNIPAIINIPKTSVYNRVKFKHVILLLNSFVFVCLDPGVKRGGGDNFYEPFIFIVCGFSKRHIMKVKENN